MILQQRFATRLSRWIAASLGLLLCACTSTEIAQPKAASPDVVQSFERKIAEHYLSSTSILPRIRDAATSSTLIQSLAWVNDADLNPSLLTKEQRSGVLEATRIREQLVFEQSHWLRMNHLADLYHALPVDSSLTTEELNVIKTNLTLQERAGVTYPESLLGPASPLINLNQSSASNINQWMRRKITPLISEQRIINFVQEHTISSSINSKVTDSYQDPRFNIRSETNYQQLTLDIVSLYIEESATPDSNLSIYGTDTHLFDIIKVNPHRLIVSLKGLTEFPAFEIQTLAYNAAGQLSAPVHWPRPWQRTMALILGQLKQQTMFRNGFYDPGVATTGFETQQKLFDALAFTEAKLSLGSWSLKDAETHFRNNTPYTIKQINYLLTQLVAEEGSYVAASIVLDRLQSPANPLKKLAPFPKDLDELIKLVSSGVDSVGS